MSEDSYDVESVPEPLPDLAQLKDRDIIVLVAQRQHSAEERAYRMGHRISRAHGRIDTLESWRNYLSGAFAVISAFLAWRHK